jgi:hypothetical protein
MPSLIHRGSAANPPQEISGIQNINNTDIRRVVALSSFAFPEKGLYMLATIRKSMRVTEVPDQETQISAPVTCFVLFTIFDYYIGNPWLTIPSISLEDINVHRLNTAHQSNL